jgi:hypothetical protein
VSLLGVHIMDDEEAVVVWSGLPDDILDKVLLCLPSHSLSRMRAVCKQWHSLLSSPSFLQRYDCRFCYGEDHVLVFVVSTCEAMMYNPISSKWHLLPLVDSPLSTLYNMMERAVTAAAGGLVCILGKNAAQDSNCTLRQLLVCNLLTKSWRCLPPLPPECPQIGQPIMGMLHDRQNFCYKIITVWPDRGPIVEYDSRNSTWTVIGRCPVSFLSFKSMQSTVCEGLLYFLVEGGPLRGGMFVRAYDIHHREWHTPSAPLPSRDLQSPCLVEHKGRILMAGLIRGVGIRLWRLKLWTMGWEIVAEMPSQLFADFNLDTPGFPSRVNCMRICDSIYFISNFRRPIVAYEVMKNVWHMLPMSYPPSCSNPDGMEQYFSVQPSLNDAV